MQTQDSLTSQAQAWLDNRRRIFQIRRDPEALNYYFDPENFLVAGMPLPVREACKTLVESLPTDHPDRELMEQFNDLSCRPS